MCVWKKSKKIRPPAPRSHVAHEGPGERCGAGTRIFWNSTDTQAGLSPGMGVLWDPSMRALVCLELAPGKKIGVNALMATGTNQLL